MHVQWHSGALGAVIGQHLETVQLCQRSMVNKICLLRLDMVAHFIHTDKSKTILMEATLKELRMSDFQI